MIRLLMVSLLLTGLASSAFATSPDPKSLVIPSEELSASGELVQQLGSELFAEREKAELALAKMGRFARPALVEAANTDSNQEIRTRCTSLLPKATALEMRARLDVFLADTDGKFEHDLPGWNQFRSTVRNEWEMFGYTIFSDRKLDAAARRVFAELIATTVNRQIVMAAGDSPQELGALVAARRQELYYQKYPRAIIIGGAIVRPTARRENRAPRTSLRCSSRIRSFPPSLCPGRFRLQPSSPRPDSHQWLVMRTTKVKSSGPLRSPGSNHVKTLSTCTSA